MILITGAGGKTGRALLEILSPVEHVCVLVREEGHAPTARRLGAKRVMIGNLQDRDVVRSAMQSVRAVYHICPNMNPQEAGIGKLIIEEARRAGVEHFIYHSVLHPQTRNMKHHWQKLLVEEMLFESSLPFTILQPSPYMQNFLATWNSILQDGILRVPYSVQSKFSFISLQDIAEVALLVLTEAGHTHAIYELAGTIPTSHEEVAEIFGQVLQRPVKAEQEEIENWTQRTKGLSEYAAANLIQMFEYYDRHGLVGNPNVLRGLLQREPTSLKSFIQKTVVAHA